MDSLSRSIYRTFSPEPLKSEQSELRVELDSFRSEATGAVSILARKIRLADVPCFQVITGHKGSGKTTELYLLRSLLEEAPEGEPRFFTVFCDALEDADDNDVDFMDVLVSIIRQLAVQIKERQGISLKPGYFRDLWERLKNLFGSSVSLDSADLAVGLASLSLALKSSPSARLEMRRLFEPDAGNWLHAANHVMEVATQELSKPRCGFAGLAVIVDNLDKMVYRTHGDLGCTMAEHLFVNRGRQLTGFHCHMVYSIPLELAYSHQEENIKQAYGGRLAVLPMTKVRQRPPDTGVSPDGLTVFTEVIQRRLESVNAKMEDLFESDDVRVDLIRLSGGQPTELMTLIREALVAFDRPIRANSVREAELRGRRDCARQLRLDHWSVLQKVASDGTLIRTSANESSIRELIHGRIILQYVNDGEWYAPNPYVEGLNAPTGVPEAQ